MDGGRQRSHCAAQSSFSREEEGAGGSSTGGSFLTGATLESFAEEFKEHGQEVLFLELRRESCPWTESQRLQCCMRLLLIALVASTLP